MIEMIFNYEKTRIKKKLEHGHSPKEIQQRLNKEQSKSFLKDFVYGAMDGIVTTFAVVAGVIGASLETRTILILGFSNIVADGFSMAASNYMGTKSEVEESKMISQYEEHQIETNPKGETEEIRQIFINKGFTGEMLEKAVTLVTENKKEWLKTMMLEEYGLANAKSSPFYAGIATFSAFIFFGSIPLLPFAFDLQNSFQFSIVFTGLAFFSVGAVKSSWTKNTMSLSGLETLTIGMLTAALAYIVGMFLSELKL